MPRRSSLSGALLLLAVSVYAVGASPQMPAFDLLADPATQSASFIVVDGRKRAGALERLAIASFTVEFVDSRAPPARSQAKRKPKDGGKDSEHEASAREAGDVVIAPDPSQLQPIVDTLYDLAIEAWRSAGATVLTAQELAQLPAYAGLTSALVGTPYRHEFTDADGSRTGLVFSAHALPAYAGAGRSPPESQELVLAKTGGVTLLSAHFVVDFVVMRNTDGRMFRSKLEPTYAETVRAAESRLRLTGPDGRVVTATLKAPVRAPESPIALGLRGSYEDDVDEDDPTKPPVQRLAVNGAAYYDQALRYLGATQDMMQAAIVRP